MMYSARDLQQSRLQLADVNAARLTLGWRLSVQLNALPKAGLNLLDAQWQALPNAFRRQ